jgi:RND family efflux transporter MFP subunit
MHFDGVVYIERRAATYLLAWVLAGLPACLAIDAADATSKSVTLDDEDTTVATRRMLRTGPRLTGTIEVRDRVEVAAQVRGTVRDVSVEIGDSVSRGQPLARIDSRHLLDALRTARARVDSAEKALELAEERVRLARHTPAAAQLQVELSARALARAQLAQARVELTSARHGLTDARVCSPLDGIVSARSVRDGDAVRVGSALFEVIDPSSLHVEAKVPSSAHSELLLGMPVEFRLRARPNESFRGSIRRVAPVVGPAGQIALSASIQNPSGQLRTGLLVEGRVTSDTQYILAVPRAALDWSGARPEVAVIRDGKIARVAVETGIFDELQSFVGIRSGIQVNERLATGSARYLAAGTHVRSEGAPGEAPAMVLESEKLAGSSSPQHSSRTAPP